MAFLSSGKIIPIKPKKDNKTVKNTKLWKGKQYKVPSLKTMEKWMYDGIAKTPDGKKVEPDHPDSWLSILGYI